MTEQTTRPCFACGCGEFEWLFPLVWRLPNGNPLPQRAMVGTCRYCGAISCHSSATQTDLRDYYAANVNYLRSNAVGMGGEDGRRYVAALSLLERHSPQKGLSALDIGCGQGGFLRCLCDNGWTSPTGLDLNRANVSGLRKAGFNVFLGDICDQPLAPRSVGTVFAMHIFEHVYDMQTALYECARVLVPQGLLYVEVPDAAGYPACSDAPLGDFIQEHINHFDASALVMCLESRGFELLETGKKSLPNGCGGDTCLYGIFRNSGRLARHSFTRERVRERQLTDLYDRHCAHMDSLARQCHCAGRVCIWGLSSYMQLVWAELEMRGVCIDGLFDASPQKQVAWKFGPLPVQPPESIRTTMAEGQEGFLLLPAGRSEKSMRNFLQASAFAGRALFV